MSCDQNINMPEVGREQTYTSIKQLKKKKEAQKESPRGTFRIRLPPPCFTLEMRNLDEAQFGFWV